MGPIYVLAAVLFMLAACQPSPDWCSQLLWSASNGIFAARYIALAVAWLRSSW